MVRGRQGRACDDEGTLMALREDARWMPQVRGAIAASGEACPSGPCIYIGLYVRFYARHVTPSLHGLA